MNSLVSTGAFGRVMVWLAGLGLLAIFGLIIIDAARHTVAWGSLGVWLWLAIFAVYFALGLGLIWWSGARGEERA